MTWWLWMLLGMLTGGAAVFVAWCVWLMRGEWWR